MQLKRYITHLRFSLFYRWTLNSFSLDIHIVTHTPKLIYPEYSKINTAYDYFITSLQVLYALYLNGNKCLLNDITKMSGISRKTIHSAIKKLETDGIVCTEPYNERNKSILLTDKGTDIANKKIAPLVRIEQDIISSWEPEERETYIKLANRYYEKLKDKIEERIMREKENLTEGSVLRHLVSFALPFLFSNFMQAFL